MRTLWHDLRYGVRMLARSPGFTTAALLTLALGIGANSAMFSVINAVMLRPLPYAEPDRLVVLWGADHRPPAPAARPPSRPRNRLLVASDLAERWKLLAASFESVAYYTNWAVNLTGAGEAERLHGGLASADLFACLRVKPALGRTFTSEEAVPGSDRVVVLSHGLFGRRFGADPSILGRTVTLDGVPYTVLGVLPAGFQVMLPFLASQPVDLWVPISQRFTPQRRWEPGWVIGRLKPGVDLRQAQAEMNTLSKRFEQEDPRRYAGRGVNVAPLGLEIAGPVRPALLVLMGAVGCVLLIACANLASLTLARGASRQKELGVRAVLGAGRGRLIRQLLTESLLVATAGGLLGLLLSVWIVDLVVALDPGHTPRLAEVGPDAAVLAFTLWASLVSGLLFGLLPAWQFSRPDVSEALKEGGTRGGGGRRWRSALVTAEVALALVLLTGAGLLLRSFMLLKAVDPGVRADNLLTLSVTLPERAYREPHQCLAFVERVLGRLRAMPAVRSAAFTNSLPMAANVAEATSFAIEGRPVAGRAPSAGLRTVTTGYFRTMGIALLRGRDFTDSDNLRADAVIINQAAARSYWGQEDALGRRILLEGRPATVVGVVADVKSRGLKREAETEVYVPFAQAPRNWLGLAVRTASDPLRVAAAVRAEIRAVDRDLPVEYVASMREILEARVARPRFNLLLLGSFAALALLLAGLGVYGVISYSVAQRTHEIGVRVALGARPGDVLRLVVGHAMLPVLGGVVIGLGASLAATRVLASLLFSVRPHDAATFVTVAALVVAVALLAGYLPARRALRVDPVVALRYE